MEDKPLDLSKKSFDSTSEIHHSSEKQKEYAKEDKPLHAEKKENLEEFSKSFGNDERAVDQESKKPVRSRQTQIEKETLEFRDIISGKSVGIKRKMNSVSATNPEAKYFNDFGSASNKKLQDEPRKLFVSDYSERTEDLIFEGPSTSTGSSYRPHEYNNLSNSTFPTPSTSACAINKYDSAPDKKQSTNRKKKSLFISKYCSKYFRLVSEYEIHFRSHTGEKPFECVICNKCFVKKSNLTSHIRLHTRERPFVCKVCNKTFTTSTNLKKHNKRHTTERNYLCPTCFKAFITATELRLHTRIHTGELPFRCQKCDRRFATSYNVAVHERTHTGEKPYMCETCGKTFSLKCNMKRHEITHKVKPKES